MSRRPLQLESLEQRQMMAGRANFDLPVAYNPYATATISSAGDLVIRGSSGHDSISVSRYSFLPDTVFIGLNGSSITVSANNVRSGKVVFSGNEGNDTFSYYDSTSQPMLLTARGGLGNDTISGAAMSDVIYGDEGNDTLYGGDGTDYLVGGSGNDTLYGDAGNDHLYGDLGTDTLRGGPDHDQLAGGVGTDWLFGEAGLDHLDGGQDYDYLFGGAEPDTFYDDGLQYAWQTGSNSAADFQYILGEFVTPTHFAFAEYVQDDALRSVVRDLSYRDRTLSRNDMLAIFEQAGGSIVSATEFRDLQYIAGDPSRFKMPEYVGLLTEKVVTGDAANAWYTGGEDHRTALGNLFAGSSGAQLNKLVDKWFKGADHPVARSRSGELTYSYQQATGDLFARNGAILYTDVRQGEVATCYFLSALAATASLYPTKIRDMFIDNGDDTYTVRLFVNGVADYVTVDEFLPVNDRGFYVYANRGTAANVSSVLWAPLAEKAYAQLNESGSINQDGTNSYQGVGQCADPFSSQSRMGIGWGSATDGLQHVTGLDATTTTINTLTIGSALGTMMNGWVNGRITMIATNSHGLAVVGRTYNSTTRIWDLLVYDPYGVLLTVTTAQLPSYGHFART